MLDHIWFLSIIIFLQKLGLSILAASFSIASVHRIFGSHLYICSVNSLNFFHSHACGSGVAYVMFQRLNGKPVTTYCLSRFLFLILCGFLMNHTYSSLALQFVQALFLHLQILSKDF